MTRTPHRRGTAAFTLLELLVVVGLIAALSSLLIGGLGDRGRASALRSAQATLANLVTAARMKAAATNRKTRLLVSVDPGSPDRYLGAVILQLARDSGASPAMWDTVQRLNLPAGVYIVPAVLDGLVADIAPWQRVSDRGTSLGSDLFANQALSYGLEGDPAPQNWTGVAFTPNGTLAALNGGAPPKGSVVLAAGRRLPPGSALPVQLDDPAAVRGLILSAYGIPALLAGREAFE